MVIEIFKFLAICLCYKAVYSASWTRTEPWVTPEEYVYDGQPYFECTCVAYLQATDLIVWGREDTGAGLAALKNEVYYSGFVTSTVVWPLDKSTSSMEIYCVKKNGTYVKDGGKSWTYTESKRIPIVFKRDVAPLDTKELQVMPSVFVDDGQQYIEFTCWGPLHQWQILSWFQVKESNVIERLASTQHYPFKFEYRKVELMKTLEESDRRTEIYCARESVLEGGQFQKDKESKRIPLDFDRRVEPLKRPHVGVQPNTDSVMFDEHEELEFECGGDETIDGRGYTWHLQGSNLHPFAPPVQRFDICTNLSRLYLRMEVFYHGSQLYCAQDFALKTPPRYGEVIVMSYRELARSRMITLLHRKQETPSATMWSKTEPWVTPVTFVDDGRPFAEFACHAYLRTGEKLAWFNGTKEDELTYLKQFKYYNGYRTLHLLVPFDKTNKGAKIFCGKQHSEKSKLEESVKMTIDFQRDNVPSERITDPQVWPSTFVDDGKPYIEFTCWAHLQNWERLSWFHVKELNKERLAMIQQEANYGFMKIDLLQTLKPSDKSTEIYCAKEKMSLNSTYSAEVKSKRILLTFDRHIEPLDPPYVTVEPSADVVLFDDNDELELVCGGSHPVDGRGLTWYSEGPYYKQFLPIVQRFNKLTNRNYLKLCMDKIPYHGSRLYCAQDFTLKTSPAFGELITTSYGEVARSKTVTVLRRSQDNPGDKPMISPRKFVDDSKPFFAFTCYAFLEKGQLLSWYQSKGSMHLLLQTIQLQDPKYAGGQWTELALTKTLEQSDKGSQIYCAKQSVLPDGSFSGELKSRRILLMFQRDIPLLEIPYTIIVPDTNTMYVDINTTLHFTCSGSLPVDGRTYTWFRINSDSNLTIPEDQKYDASTNINVLKLSPTKTCHQSELYCAQGFLSYIRHTDGSLHSKFYGELAKSDVITLILPEKAKPQVTPEIFEDKNKSSIQFICRAFLQTGELLAWYQSKGSSDTILLRIIQTEEPQFEHGQWMELTLKKTLEQSDKDSEIYCAKQRVLPDGSFSDGLKSQTVPLKFTRDIPPMKLPYVNIEPNTSVHYVANTTLRFTCSGSYPVGDRTYTWFRIDSDSNVIVPEDQKYDATTNMNVLELSLSETYNRSQLYCAQGFLSYIRHSDGSLRSKFYGELSKSDAITLILHVKGDKPLITPENFTDKGNSFIRFTCHAFLETGQLLLWYQSKGSDRSNDKLLRITQLDHPGTERGQLVTMNLKKTLEPLDRDSEIYCIKKNVPQNRSSSDALESQRVLLTFKRDIPLLELPFVTIEPNRNVVYFDNNTTLRFICSGSIPVDGRTYAWFRIDSDSNLTIPEDQKYDTSTNLNLLQLSTTEECHQSELYCTQGFLSYIRHADGSLHSNFYGELAKSNVITLILPEKAKPQVTPEIFEDKNKSSIQFICRAFLQTGELLAWYQSKGSPGTILLRMIQTQEPQSDRGQWMELTLKKTLEQSDKDSEIYCAKQRMLPDGSFSDGFESQRVPLTFTRDIPPMKLPYVNIEPNTNVHYVVNTTLRFTCSGSYPVGDRTYTWFRIDSDANVIVPDDQKYDATKNMNVLELSLSETYNRSQLYCAQGFLSYIRHTNGSQRSKFYGELSKSDAITLILHVKGDRPLITPENFTDKGNSFIRFTCHAFLETGQLLLWYQSKGSDRSRDKLLRIIQLERPGTETGQLVTLNLKKTLEPLDRDSEIYCVKKNVLQNRSSSDALESQRVLLTFKRDIPLLEFPFVTIEPNRNVVYFDNNTTLRFICSGSIPVDGRTYAWFRIDSDSNLTIPEDQKYEASTNLNVLQLSPTETYHQSELYCAQGFLSYIRHADGSLHSNFYGELAKSDVTTLILPEKAKPQVTPEIFEDKNKSSIQFICRAFLQTGELLAWYQSKGSPGNILLRMIQTQDSQFERGQWMKLTLKKTLEQSDKDSDIYCAKQRMLPDGSFSDGFESQRVPLTFTRDIPPIKLPYVNIEPNTNVHYVVNTTLRFTCSGSYPVGDRTYTWFRIDSDANVIVPEDQKYDATKNMNVLELSLSETYNRSQLYCAQGFLSYIRQTDGSQRSKFYGELSKSDAITLILHVKGDRPLITPENFTDKGNSFIRFTCHAFLETGQLLLWYQSKGSDRSRDKLLRIIQLEHPGTERGQLVTLNLKKTLEPLDRDSEIYCVKKNVLQNQSSSEPMESQRVLLTFKRDIPLLELPFVTIEPSTNFVYFDINTTLRFICSGSIPVDGRTYAWFRIDADSNLTIPEDQKYDASTNLNVLQLSPTETYHQSELYCAQGFLSYIRHADDSLHSNFYGELAKSDVITLILPEKAKPQVTPEIFEDKNKSSILQFICRAFLQTGELLTWYQSKGSPDTIVLRMIQIQDPQFERGQWMELTLKKTLELTDKDSVIYCAKQRVLPDGSFSDGLESQRVPLTFTRDIPPMKLPYVNIEPNTSVHYVSNTTLRFICSGSYPVDDRTYTWFRIDSDSDVIVPEDQKYDATKNMNVLELSLSETYNRSQLYCAQGFLSYIRHSDGSLRSKFYGELSKSEAIILILHVKDDKPFITPENFTDEGDSFVRFTCHAFLETGQLLLWYQSKGSDRSKDRLLRIIQLDHPGTERGQLVTINLKKTLEPLDRDSEIYCVKQNVLPNGHPSDALESQRVLLTFKRDIPLLEPPFVIIEPNTNVVYFDNNTTLRFICSGSIPVDDRTYAWLRIDSDSNLTIPEDQKYDASTNLNVLQLSPTETCHQSELYCAQGFLSYIRHADGSLHSKFYGELAKSDMITLVVPGKAKPQVTPGIYEDKNKSSIQFTCRAFLQTGELLAWYQSKGLPRRETILLRMIQIQDPQSERGNWMELTLKKTLEQSDKDSKIYCARQSVLPDGSFSDGLESQRVPLTFTRDISPLELPFVNIEPNKSVYYVVDTRIRFTCSGSYPVDDRTYTWFRKDSNSNVIIPEDQKYEATTNMNVLELSLSETYNRSQLYCAQGFLTYIRHSDGSLRSKFYGELARSNMITLILLVKDGNPQISPEIFTDELQSSVQFHCYAVLRAGELLTWYQSKGNGSDELLTMTQLLDNVTEEGRRMDLSLIKTLDQSDRDSEIYCARQHVLPDGSFSNGLKSRIVALTLHRTIPAAELPYVVVEPTSRVIFDVNATSNRATFLRFTCTGSSPVDGRTYTWFIIDSNSNGIIPEDQKYDASTNLNVLYLSPKESYHQNQLYCAQGFLSYIRHTDGTLRSKFYGELARSGMISLTMAEKGEQEANVEKAEQPVVTPPTCPVTVEPFVTVLSVALPLALAALAAVLAALAAAAPPETLATPATLATSVTPATATPQATNAA